MLPFKKKVLYSQSSRYRSIFDPLPDLSFDSFYHLVQCVLHILKQPTIAFFPQSPCNSVRYDFPNQFTYPRCPLFLFIRIHLLKGMVAIQLVSKPSISLPHTIPAKSHSINRCCIVSSCFLHKQHRFTMICLFSGCLSSKYVPS